jgi:hypothetical protein
MDAPSLRSPKRSDVTERIAAIYPDFRESIALCP